MAPGKLEDVPGSVSGSGGRTTTGREGYQVEDIVLNDPQQKRLRIAMIGAGVSGIMMAYKVQKHMQNYDFDIYEKNEEIGGTWWLNRYPGAACDIPSHAYTYNFALNPDWPAFFSPSADIWAYLDRVCNTFNLRQYMQFSSEVTRAEWQESSSTWRIWVKQTSANGETKEFTDECEVLLHATGVLNNFKWPDITGFEKFKGRMVHTARWPKDYQAEAWKGQKVAVIGSGASSIQTVPSMQPHVAHMDVFVRTPVWFVNIAGDTGDNKPYTAEQIKQFHEDPKALLQHAKSLEDVVNGGWMSFVKGSDLQKELQRYYTERTAGIIKDPVLFEKMMPKWTLGCRRITPGDGYMRAIQEPNVQVHFTEVVEITETGLKGKDGTEVQADTIVCATGFDTSFRPAFPILGRNGVSLADKWKTVPEAYLGLGVPDMPNFFTFIGPAWPIGNGSVMGPLEAVGDYVIQFLQKMQVQKIKSFEPKQDVTDQFNEHVQAFMPRTVWTDDCRSWYKDNKTNRVNALWPGGSLHYIDTIRTPRYEDFNYSYSSVNMFAYLGNGKPRVLDIPNGDKSPYFQLENVDEKWLSTVIGVKKRQESVGKWGEKIVTTQVDEREPKEVMEAGIGAG